MSVMKPDVTITEIIERAGGPGAIARACVAAGAKLTKDAVYKWPHIGIPDRHWPIIIALTSCDPLSLYIANCAARGQSFDVQTPRHEAAE